MLFAALGVGPSSVLSEGTLCKTLCYGHVLNSDE